MEWKKKTTIEAPIEKVWRLFNEENYMRIMPQVVAYKKISSDPKTRTTIYEETYREGKREETYELTEVIEIDTETEKLRRFSFTVANAIVSKGSFHLKRIDENRTEFIYSGSNVGKNLFFKFVLRLSSKKANEKVVVDFMNRVKAEAQL
ncbi:SRPBCC family protein [Erysipelothrix sp. HDW6C]|uniref:SRPBCC family protein n=1 Tax=Erysipelothrix sp. HDW6C TaxID=2714930 RepID=UPI001408B09A|nr:SRPBCC family protein [Erysipelothrix sp. HDW6C]QIK69583.1 SRPBCC family protein [Erysipelothrix sp. HDW6C]